jgi:3-oxoacyl-[acyl-carrier-protein] synthase-3
MTKPVYRLGSVWVSATELSSRYSGGIDDPEKMIGISGLYRLGPKESLMDLVEICINESLQTAGLSRSDIGAIVATSNHTGLYLLPSLAATIANRIGCTHLPADTIGDGCGGIVQAIGHGVAMMTSSILHWRSNKVVVVVAAEEYSKHINHDDRRTRYIFSDGVSVTILAQSSRPVLRNTFRIRHIGWRSLTSNSPLTALSMKNPAFSRKAKFEMNSIPVIRFTREVLRTALECIDLTNWSGVSIIPHQANLRILRGIAPSDADFIYTEGIELFGNTLNASTLIGLTDCADRGLIPSKSDHIALVPFGAGWLVGCILIAR